MRNIAFGLMLPFLAIGYAAGFIVSCLRAGYGQGAQAWRWVLAQ